MLHGQQAVGALITALAFIALDHGCHRADSSLEPPAIADTSAAVGGEVGDHIAIVKHEVP